MFRLGVLLSVVYLRTIFAVRQNGLFAARVVELLASLLCAIRLASTRHRVPICFREVYSVVLVNVRPCLYPSLRGRPRTVLYVRARATLARHRVINSIVLRAPGRSIIVYTPGQGGRGPGVGSSWQGAAGIRSPEGGESTLSQKSKGVSAGCVVDATLQVPDAEDRATVGTDPSAAVRARRGMRVGRTGSPLFFAPREHSSLSFMR